MRERHEWISFPVEVDKFFPDQNVKIKQEGRVMEEFFQKWMIFYIFKPVILFSLLKISTSETQTNLDSCSALTQQTLFVILNRPKLCVQLMRILT